MSSGLKTKSPNEGLCQIIREQEYEENLHAMARDTHRMDEIDSALDWALARGPVYFYQVDEEHYLYKNEGLYHFPDFRVLYRYDKINHRIFLLSIEAIPPSEED